MNSTATSNTSTRSEAARKAWRTRRANSAAAANRATARKRSIAAYKAWETRRANGNG